MLNPRRSPILALTIALVLTLVSGGYGQEADADKAASLLKQAIAYFNALEFRQAKATLMKVNRADLADADKVTLDEYLGAKVDPAIKSQMAAMTAYKDAEKAVQAGDLAGAEASFKAAAASEYLPAAVRQDAEAQMAVVQQKMLVVAQAAAEKPPAVSAEPLVSAGEAKAQPKAQPFIEDQPVKVAAVKEAEPQKQAKETSDDIQARQAKAVELMTMGQKALDENQPERAAGYFQRAMALTPDSEQARRQLDYSRSLVANVPESGIIPRMERRRRIAKQAADVDFEAALDRSRKQLATADRGGQFDGAESAARSASTTLETNKDLYSETEYRERLVRAQMQLDQIHQVRDEWSQQRVRQQAEEILKREQDRRFREQEDRQRKVDQLTGRTRTLWTEGKFVQALEIAKQILLIDPANSWAAEKVEMLEQFILTQQEKVAEGDQRYEEQRQMIEVKRAEIPWWEILKYPEGWKDLTVKREPFGAAGAGESARDRQVRMKLEKVLTRIEFPGADFEEAVTYLRELSGLNIFVKWETLEMAGIDRAKEINISLNDVTTEKALKVVLDDVGGSIAPLSYIVDEGVITISTKDDLSTRAYPKVYDIRDLIVRVPNFEAPDIDMGGSGGGNDDSGGWGNVDDEGDDNENVATKQELIDNIITMVSETIDPMSWPPNGDVGSIRELHGQLVVTQTSDNHKKLADLIKQLREARALQVAIEARFISVNSGFLNSIGIDLDFFFNIGSRLGSTSVTDPFTGASVPTTGGASGWGANAPGDNKWSPMAVNQNSIGFTNMLGVETPMGGIGGQVTNAALSLGGTFLDDIQVDFLIQATQAHSSTRSLSAPRLTLFNGQQAYVFVGTTQSYVSDLDPVVSDNAIAFNPIPGQVASGTLLEVEAVVSADRRYVTLTVSPTVTTVNGFDRYAVITTATDAAGNPITGEGFIQQPNMTIQTLETTVSVPDGGTLLLGGQRLSGEVEREMGVPLLNKIPILNRAFTNRGVVRDEQTLLILIKPKIIIHSEEEERQQPG